jgi:hypothetical protein
MTVTFLGIPVCLRKSKVRLLVVARCLLALTFVFPLAGGLAVNEACAQRKVRDNRLRERTGRENEQRFQEIALKLWELEELVRQAEALVSLTERTLSVRDIRDAVDVYTRAADVLAFGTSDLEALFNEIMIASTLPEDLEDHFQVSAEVLIDTYQNLLLAVREQMRAIDASETTIRELRDQVVREADNEMKAIQMQSAIELFKAEELMLLRQALAIQANAQSLMGAYDTSQEAIEVAIIRKALEGE